MYEHGLRLDLTQVSLPAAIVALTCFAGWQADATGQRLERRHRNRIQSPREITCVLRHNTAQYMKLPCSRYPCGHPCRHLCWTIITVTGILLYFSRPAYLSFCMSAIILWQERPSPMNHKLSGYGMGRIVKTRAVMAQARIDRTANGVHPSDERPLR